MEPKANYTRHEVMELILELRNIAMYSNSHVKARQELKGEINGFETRNGLNYVEGLDYVLAEPETSETDAVVIKSAEEVLYERWKEWMSMIFKDPDMSFETFKEDTSWMFFVPALKTYHEQFRRSKLEDREDELKLYRSEHGEYVVGYEVPKPTSEDYTYPPNYSSDKMQTTCHLCLGAGYNYYLGKNCEHCHGSGFENNDKHNKQ